MKPAPFVYHRPTTAAEAAGLLAEHGDEAKPIAGGQSLVPILAMRLGMVGHLVDLNHVEELAGIERSNGHVRIGAMTRQRSVERSPLVADQAPLIHETMPYIAHPQIRNRGTFGGNLAHTDPASELPAVATALNARFRAQSRSGQRWLTADEFFVDLFTTALEPEELLVEIVIPPLPAQTGYAFREISRRHGDYALVGVAATVTLDNNGRCEAARLVYLSVGDKPVEAVQATAALAGQKLSAAAIDAAAEIAAAQDIDPPGDIHASVTYRRHLAKVLAKQVLAKATARAKQE